MAKPDLQEATSDLEIEGQGHKTIAFMTLPIYTHITNLKIFFNLSRLKGNLCSGGGGGVTVLNPKYPQLLSRDTIKSQLRLMNINDLVYQVEAAFLLKYC